MGQGAQIVRFWHRGSAGVSFREAAFTADGRGVYVITNRDSEFEQLRRVDLVTGAVEVLTAHIPWDIDGFERTADGKYLAWVANVDGMSRLTVVDLASVVLREPGPVSCELVARATVSRIGGESIRRHAGASSTGGFSGSNGSDAPPCARNSASFLLYSARKPSQPSFLIRNLRRLACLCL